MYDVQLGKFPIEILKSIMFTNFTPTKVIFCHYDQLAITVPRLTTMFWGFKKTPFEVQLCIRFIIVHIQRALES